MCEFGQKIAIGLNKYKLEVGINNLENTVSHSMLLWNKQNYLSTVKIYWCCQLLVRFLVVVL